MDRCGKDTVIRGLVDARRTTKPLHIIHNVAPPRALKTADARRYQLECYLAQLQMVDEYDAHDFIVNRSWMSEEVYGHLYRGQPARLPAEWMADAAAALSRQKHLVVLLTDSGANVVARTDGDSTFQKSVIADGSAQVLVKDRAYHERMAERERQLFVDAVLRLEEYGIAFQQWDGRHPDEVLPLVRRALGW